MKSSTQQQLDENIPKDVISSREQAGRKLSYLETWYVIDRLNQIIGQGLWNYQVINLNKVFEGQDDKSRFITSYTAVVALNATVDGRSVAFSDVGYGDGMDARNPGKAHELAVKEAVSDGVKRAAKNLGRSLGLALYDKTQEYVGEPVMQPVVQSTAHVINKTEPEEAIKQDNRPQSLQGAGISSGITKKLITESYNVLKLQGKVTAAEFKTKYQNNKPLSELDDSALKDILVKVRTDYPELVSKGA